MKKLYDELSKFTAAILISLLFVYLITSSSYYTVKTYEAVKTEDIPFDIAEVSSVVRLENILYIRAKIEQKSFCEFDEKHPSYFRYTYDGKIAASDILSIGGNKLASRNPFKIGQAIDVGVVEVAIPEKVRNLSGVIAQAVIRCYEKDGILKSFPITPVFKIDGENIEILG